MPNFLARVELHGARSQEDYLALHSQLQTVRFYNSIATNQNTILRIPTGTYSCYGTYRDIDSACMAVKQAANAAGFASSIVCVSFDTWQGYDLPNG
jgi:hypothetical protein